MNKQLIAVFAALLAFALSSCSDNSTEATPAVLGWQTYCSVPIDTTPKHGSEFTVHKVGRPSKDIRSGQLIVDNGELRAHDISNFQQFRLEGDTFKPVAPVACPPFQAYGWEIHISWDGLLEACQFSYCPSVYVRPRTMIFAVAAANGGIFVGTSFGEAMLFRDRHWCRLVNINDVYTCDGSDPPIPEEGSNQFYSSTAFQGRSLVGEYPTGRIFEFDGESVRPSSLTPPAITARGNGYESQTLATYCGNLFVGYWPYGEIFRYDGEKWHDPIRLFTTKPSFSPFQTQAVAAGLPSNFFGQRVASLVPYKGSLYAITSNKGDWNRHLTPEIPKDVQEQYGSVFKITSDTCS